MKKLLLSLSVVAALFTSCTKESSDQSNQTGDPSIPKAIAGISQVPGNFTKKALIESFTGASYNKSPETDALVKSLVLSNPGRVIAAGIHQGDQMEIPFAQNVNLRFNNGSVPPVPSAMLSRVPIANNLFLNTNQMVGFANKNFNLPAKCGLAINSAVQGRKAYISVHAGFNQALVGTHALTVYLTENNLSKSGKGYDQLNTYNYVTGSAFYNMGDPIIGYVHQNVLRMVLTNDIGNTINPAICVTGGHEIQNFIIDIPYTMDLNQLNVIGFVNKVGSSPLTHEVLNAQIAKLGTLKNWD